MSSNLILSINTKRYFFNKLRTILSFSFCISSVQFDFLNFFISLLFLSQIFLTSICLGSYVDASYVDASDCDESGVDLELIMLNNNIRGLNFLLTPEEKKK